MATRSRRLIAYPVGIAAGLVILARAILDSDAYFDGTRPVRAVLALIIAPFMVAISSRGLLRELRDGR
jgi:hypothetical protein